MRPRFFIVLVAALLAIAALPRPAAADATVFIGKTTSPVKNTVRGFAAGISLLIIGFEFEYASTTEDEVLLKPSLRTTSGNVLIQTPGLTKFQLYLTTGAGFYRERLGSDQETSFLLNNGGGAKIPLAGPLRVRIDYRVFNLRGNPQHSTIQRIYAGANLAF